MKVIFLTHQNPQGYRIQDYFSYLERHGVRVEVRIVPREKGVPRISKAPPRVNGQLIAFRRHAQR